jgi:hypothetical protein
MNAHEIPFWVTLLCTSTFAGVLIWTTWMTPQDPQRLDPEAAKTLDKSFRDRIRLLSKR